MSGADNWTHSRDPLDRYYTPDDLARSCVSVLPIKPGETIVDPNAGGGAFLRAAVQEYPRAIVSGIDIDRDCPARRMFPVEHANFLWWSPSEKHPPPDWFIGNPPYNDAEKHVRRALHYSKVGCAFLLRLAFTESQARIPFWKLTGPALDEVRVCVPRPSFLSHGGTDATAYAWFVWKKKRRGPSRIVPGWNWKEV